jgi:voltage-gated potassium channel
MGVSHDHLLKLPKKYSSYGSFKKRVYDLLDPRMDSGWGKVVNYMIIGLIFLNTAAVIMETVDEFHRRFYYFLEVFDLVSIIIFSIEYLLRVWSCTADHHFKHPFYGRLRYIFTPGALIDLFAILPFYVHVVIGLDLRFIRTLRLMLFFRFLKLGRYLTAGRVIGKVIRSKKEELTVSLMLTFFLIILSACLMYYTEHQVQPEKFSNIPQTMWWSVCTLTTVGYGDMYPVTNLGKTLTSVIAILGIGMLALPTGILASGFSEEFHKKKHSSHYCPHCGEKLDV